VVNVRSSSVVVVASVAILCWSIFLIHHPFHDHAIAFISYDASSSHELGRFGFDLIAGATAGADIYVWNYVVAITCMILISVLISRRMKLPDVASLIFGLVFVSSPIWLGVFYYHDLVAMALIAVLLSVASACLGVSMVGIAGSILGLILCLSVYQPAANVSPIGVALLLLADALDEKSTRRTLAIQLVAKIATLLAALIAYFVLIRLVAADGSFATSVSGSALDLSRITILLRAMFDHFWVTQPDFPLRVRLVELLVLLGGILLMIIFVRSNARRVWAVVLLIGLVIASKAMFFLVDRFGEQLIYQYRYNLGRPLLMAGVISLRLSQVLSRRPSYSVLPAVFIIASCALTVVYVQQSLIRQTVLMHGQQVDTSIMQRVLVRLENSGVIDPAQSYQFVRTGPLSTVREEMLIAQNGLSARLADEHMDYGSIGNLWVPESLFFVLGSNYDFKQNTIENWRQRTLYWRQVAQEQGRAPWPAKGSLFVSGNNVILHTYGPNK